MNVNLHIDRLVLDGIALSPADRVRLQAVVEQELRRQIVEAGIPPSLTTCGATHELTAGEIRLADANGPQALGKQIARSVYGGLGQ